MRRETHLLAQNGQIWEQYFIHLECTRWILYPNLNIATFLRIFIMNDSVGQIRAI